MTLSFIHVVAEPQMITISSLREEAQSFQKYSKALTNFDLGVSSHGISSMNITTLFFAIVPR